MSSTLKITDEQEELRFENVKNVAEKEEYNYHQVAQEIVRQYGIVKEIETGHLFWHDGKKYRFNGKERVEDIAEKLFNSESSNHKVREVVGACDRLNHQYRDQIFSLPNHKIVVKNGILDLLDGELEDLSDIPNNRPGTKIALDVEWNPDCDEECKEVLEFLNDICPDSKDVQKILEGIGHCLYRDWVDHKSFMFLGSGANGKSTLLETITELLGEDHVSHVPLQNIGHRFSASDLDGQLANICADISDKALKYTGMFKMLTGEDRIRAERKYESAYSFRNTAKMFFSCNELPETDDNTDAFFRRWEIIDFPKTFKGDDADPHLKEKLTTDEMLEAWLYLAVDAFQQLYSRGRFMEGGTNQEIKEKWERESNPRVAFVKDNLEEGTGYVTRNEVWNEWLSFCNNNNVNEGTNRKLYNTIRRQFSLSDDDELERSEGYTFEGVVFSDDEAENNVSQKDIVKLVTDKADEFMDESIQGKFQRSKLVRELENDGYSSSRVEDCIDMLVKRGEFLEPQEGYLRVITK